MIHKVPVQEFLVHAEIPIIDVRAPQEYSYAHIQGAQSVPLFSDQARAHIGTLYKQHGKEAAVKLGLSLVGPRLHELVELVETVAPEKIVRLHCWRGGMRSASFAWLLDLNGYTVYLLDGGYKAYRAYIRQQFAKKYMLITISGKTGSGKTDFLKKLKDQNHQTLDLENLAGHKGSVFGHIGLPKQPTQEQFENKLGQELLYFDASKPIFVEKESRRIGQLLIPDSFFEQITSARSLYLESTNQERIERIMRDYGSADKETLCAAVKRLEKRLGGLVYKEIITYIQENNYHAAIRRLLLYYDRYYGQDEAAITHVHNGQTFEWLSTTTDL